MSSSVLVTEQSPGTEAFWVGDMSDRLGRFADLRSRTGLTFHTEHTGGPGFWSVVGHADVTAVSTDPGTFSSAAGFTINDLPPEVLEFAASMIASDDPKHARLRRIVQSAFTVPAVRRIADRIAAHSVDIVNAVPTGTFDFVEHVSNQLPLRVICELIGIPQQDHGKILRLSDEIVGVSGDAFTTGPGAAPGLFEVYQYALDLGAQRAADPTGDIVSRLVHAGTSGDDALTPSEFGSFLILLITAGHDTTRQTLSWALALLTQNPQQREVLLSDFDVHVDGAVDEVVRYASPVPYMRRTATRPTTLAGTDIAAGEKIVMWYLSANHDDTVFESPDAFDITRANVGAHVGFGARSPHHCLGANLAKLEVSTLLRELFARHPDIRSVEEPVLVNSAFVSGIAELPARI